MDLHLTNKCVVITGGGTGIGKETALEFLREGAKVSVCGRKLEKLEAMRADVRRQGFEVGVYSVDVADVEGMRRMASEIADVQGGIDIWINNAGVGINKPVMEFTDEDYAYIMDINLKAVFEGSRIAARHMIEQGRGGVILNASSYASKIPHTEGAIYAAAKAGVSSFTKTFAANLAPHGIRVLAYIPGMIETEISRESIADNRERYTANISLQRLGVPTDLAKPLVFLASDAAGYMTGVDVEISGGKYAVQNALYSWEHKQKA